MALRKFAGGNTFAHLLGRSKAASGKSKAEDDAGETDEERRERERKEREDAKATSEKTEEEGEGGKTEESKASKSKADREEEDMDKADDLRKDGDEEEDDEGEHDPDEVDERNRAGKKSKRANASDDEADTRSAGRKAERARGAAIFASPAAALRPDMAAHLAFQTNLSTRAAIDTLAATAAGTPQGGRRNGVADRMAATPNPDVGQEDQRPSRGRASLGDRAAAVQKKIGAA